MVRVFDFGDATAPILVGMELATKKTDISVKQTMEWVLQSRVSHSFGIAFVL